MSIKYLLYNIRYRTTESTYCTQMKNYIFQITYYTIFTNARVCIVLPLFVLKYQCTRVPPTVYM
jgi:hypothetical protein